MLVKGGTIIYGDMVLKGEIIAILNGFWPFG
jgi:hypothetical protein